MGDTATLVFTETSSLIENLFLGYIPGGKHFFGERYAVLIKRARMEQKNSLQWNACKLDRQQRTQKYDMESIRSRQLPTIPLKPIAEKTPMYYPKVTQHSVSPYTLRNDHPGKHFIAGYTGFVPRARQFMGELTTTQMNDLVPVIGTSAFLDLRNSA